MVPKVIKMKDDVLYISGAKPEWGFMSLVGVGEEKQPVLILALQEDQAIGLSLEKTNALGQTIHEEKVLRDSSFSFGTVQNILGQKIKESQTKENPTYRISLE